MSQAVRPQLFATVFSDYICPFCYIGDLRLERLREHFDLKINWCLVEIHPETPASGQPVSELGYSTEQWYTMMDNLDRLAREEGVKLRQHDFTTSSHQALLLAEASKEAGAGIFYAVHRRLFTAFFEDGLNIGDAGLLAKLAADSGVPDEVVNRAWNDDRYEQRLEANLAAAVQHQVQATPTIIFSETTRLNGAVPFDAFLKAARQGFKLQQKSE